MSKPFETITNEEKKKLAALLAAAETQDEHPPWYNGKRIDEVAYCESLLAEQELRCINGRLYSIDGIADDLQMKARIAADLKPYIRSSLNRTVERVLESLKLLCMSEPVKPTSDRVHFKNGTYILGEGFIPSKEWTMNRLPIDYSVDASTPVRWLSFLTELLHEEDIPLLQEFLGYCMTATTRAQAMLLILGNGGEGKSRISAVMQTVFGCNANVGSISQLENDKFYPAELEGKLLFMDDDMKMEALGSSNNIKAIVTCDGKMTLERKGKQAYQGVMYARLFGLGNGSLKALHDKSHGFYRRQIIIRTKDKPPQRKDDPFLKEKLDAEIPGIVQWCIEGLTRLVENEYRFSVSERSAQLKKELMDEDNNIRPFLGSTGYIQLILGAQSTTKRLYEAYGKWCFDNAEKPMAESTFSKYLHQNAAAIGIRANPNVKMNFHRYARGFDGIKVMDEKDVVFTPLDGDDPDFPF